MLFPTWCQCHTPKGDMAPGAVRCHLVLLTLITPGGVAPAIAKLSCHTWRRPSSATRSVRSLDRPTGNRHYGQVWTECHECHERHERHKAGM
jgi:hypothetical protein